MKRRILPGTEDSLSVVGFGCWAMGKTWWGDDVEDAVSIRAVHAALDAGINWFDTAPLYGHGHADQVLAKALAGREAFIATKVGVRWDGEHAQSDLRPQRLRADLEASLTRLDRDHIDLLQVHWPCDLDTPLEESFPELAKLQQEGLIRHLGVCNYDAKRLHQIRKITPIVSLQTPWSMVRREFEETLHPACATLGLGVLAYEPLCRGLLTGKYRSRPHFPDTDQRSWDERFQGPAFFHVQRLLRDLDSVSKRSGLPLSSLALGWLCSRSPRVFAIAGAKRPEQVWENVQFSEQLHRKKLWEIVDKILGIIGGTPRFH